MNLDLQAIRSELAALADKHGWHTYEHIPGAANLPAVVIGLPDPTTFDGSFRFASLTVPVYLVIGNRVTAATESDLMAKALEVAAVFNAQGPGNSFRSVVVDSIGSFETVAVGSAEGLSVSVNLTLLAQL